MKNIANIKAIIKWFSVLVMIADTVFIVWLRFSQPDMTQVRWFITYWKEWSVYFLLLWLLSYVYMKATAKS